LTYYAIWFGKLKYFAYEPFSKSLQGKRIGVMELVDIPKQQDFMLRE